MHLPDPSCDLAQSFTVKNNQGLELGGVGGKLFRLHGNKEEGGGKPSLGFPADVARGGGCRGWEFRSPLVKEDIPD